MRAWLLVLLVAVPVAAYARHPVVVDRRQAYRLAGGRALVADVYRPRDAGERRPAVVCLHGGSWNTGDRWDMAPFARDLAERGFVATTVDYRLAGEARFPAAVADARHAVRWLATHHRRFGVDPARIGVFGPSAGGHLALLVATLPARGGARTRLVNACAAWSAPADLVRGLTGSDAVPRASLEAVERFLGGSFDAHRNVFALASPATHVSRDTPPLFLAHGDRDRVVPFSQSEYMREAAEHHGVDVTLLRVRDADHELCGPRADPAPEAVWEATVAFFERALSPRASGVLGVNTRGPVATATLF